MATKKVGQKEFSLSFFCSCWIWVPGPEIRDKHPGSATLVPTSLPVHHDTVQLSVMKFSIIICQICGNPSAGKMRSSCLECVILLRNVCGTPLKLGQQVNRVHSQLVTAGPAATLPSTLPGFPVPTVPYRRLPVTAVSCQLLGRVPKTVINVSLFLPALYSLLPIIHCCCPESPEKGDPSTRELPRRADSTGPVSPTCNRFIRPKAGNAP